MIKSEELIRDHIRVLQNAVEFMKRKGGKEEWINSFNKTIEILKWVIDDKSEYDEIYNGLMKMTIRRKKYESN